MIPDPGIILWLVKSRLGILITDETLIILHEFRSRIKTRKMEVFKRQFQLNKYFRLLCEIFRMFLRSATRKMHFRFLFWKEYHIQTSLSHSQRNMKSAAIDCCHRVASSLDNESVKVVQGRTKSGCDRVSRRRKEKKLPSGEFRGLLGRSK